MLDPSAIDALAVLDLKQVTDVYLLATAVANGGRFATLDTGVPLSAVPGAAEANLAVI